MSLSHSPKVVTNGLVFYYDMANSQKSWKGKPVTNLVNPVWSNWSIDGSGQGSIGTRTITSPYECTIVDNNANTRQNIYISSGITAGTTYTFSVQYKKNYGTPTLRFQIQAYNGSTYLSTMSFATTAQLGILDIGEWQTAKITLTTPASTNRILWFMQDGDDYVAYTHSFSLKNVQCEQNSFATPFVDGTRSNTQALLDLTGNNTVTANSLTYASDGTFSFNGSSNNISIGSFSGYSTNLTCEAWFKTTSGATWKNIVCGPTNDVIFTVNGGLLNFGCQGSTPIPHANYSTTTVNTGAWFHGVATYNGNTVKIYINGNLESTNARTGTITAGAKNIGSNSGGTSEYFNGTIDNVKMYNRALSAGEVAQNFNALRGRYGI